jgi:hypothetical protein
MWCLHRSRLNCQKMRNSVLAFFVVLALGSCTSSLLKEQRKLQSELATYRNSDEDASVSDVQECWKRDTLLVYI